MLIIPFEVLTNYNLVVVKRLKLEFILQCGVNRNYIFLSNDSVIFCILEKHNKANKLNGLLSIKSDKC